MSDKVLYSASGRVATITVNRPEVRNAIDRETAAAIAASLARMEGDPQVWVGVVRSTGDAAFSAGADLKAMSRGEPPAVVEGSGFAGFVHAPRTKPVIAAVSGFALGGGFEIVLASDLAVAAAGTVFGLPEVSRGIIAGGGGLLRLAWALPSALAVELCVTGRRLPAEEALRLGLINRVVAAEQLDGAVAELAASVCANAPLAVRESLEVIRKAPFMGWREAWELSDAASRRVKATRDAAEGPRAFLERRPPVWRQE